MALGWVESRTQPVMTRKLVTDAGGQAATGWSVRELLLFVHYLFITPIKKL